MKFSRAPHRRLLALALAGIALAAPAVAAAAAPTPKMTVGFTKRSVDVVGTRAVVPVRCNGMVARECVGTLTLETSAGVESVPYAIGAGERRVIVVPLPLGTPRSTVGAKAVTETMQLSGESVRTARVLRIK